MLLDPFLAFSFSLRFSCSHFPRSLQRPLRTCGHSGFRLLVRGGSRPVVHGLGFRVLHLFRRLRDLAALNSTPRHRGPACEGAGGRLESIMTHSSSSSSTGGLPAKTCVLSVAHQSWLHNRPPFFGGATTQRAKAPCLLRPCSLGDALTCSACHRVGVVRIRGDVGVRLAVPLLCVQPPAVLPGEQVP